MSIRTSNFLHLPRKKGPERISDRRCPVVKVNVFDDRVLFENLESRDPEVVSFFAEMPLQTIDEVALRALTVGVVGLKAMGVAGRMELVEKEFMKLSHEFNASLAVVEKTLTDRVDSTFDPSRA